MKYFEPSFQEKVEQALKVAREQIKDKWTEEDILKYNDMLYGFFVATAVIKQLKEEKLL